MTPLPEYIDGLPNLCGAEQAIEHAIAAGRERPVFLADSRIDFSPWQWLTSSLTG
jgi:hypothetical protein